MKLLIAILITSTGLLAQTRPVGPARSDSSQPAGASTAAPASVPIPGDLAAEYFRQAAMEADARAAATSAAMSGHMLYDQMKAFCVAQEAAFKAPYEVKQVQDEKTHAVSYSCQQTSTWWSNELKAAKEKPPAGPAPIDTKKK